MDDDDKREEEKDPENWDQHRPPPDREKPQEHRRELYIQNEKHWASISSTYGDGERPLFFEFSVWAEDHLSVEATYGGMSDKGGDQTGIRMDFSGIVEYYDSNGDGLYQAELDKAVSTYPLSSDFFVSDFWMGEGEYGDVWWDEEPEYHFDEFMEMDYSEGFNDGFLKGFEHGYDHGIKDYENEEEFDPDIYSEYTEEEILNLLGLPDVHYDDDIEGDLSEDEYYLERMGWYEYGIFKGFINGYEVGYEKGWAKMEEEELGTRQGEEKKEEEEWDEGEDWEKDEYDEDWGRYMDEGFQFVRYHPIKIEKKDINGHKQMITLKVHDLKGIFSIVCKVSNDFTEMENGYISPYAIKIDLHFTEYPFTDEGTRLALLTDVGITTETMGEFQYQKKDKSFDEENGLTVDEEEISLGDSQFSGFFSWVKYAMCDGHNKSVKVSNSGSFYSSSSGKYDQFTENYVGLIFNYPQAKKIIHDPKIGFISVSGIDLYESFGSVAEKLLNGNIWIYAITAVIAIGFVVVTRQVRQRYY